ncbi:MAG TPA: hypothetical protein VIH80_00615 [Steroidobacteraceae bacterium]
MAETLSHARDILVIPCWRRPEFLWHCLDNLRRAEGIGDLHVLFRPDRGHDPRIHDVIDEFGPQLGSYEIDLPAPCPYRRGRQSANLLAGYLQAAARTRRYVFMVEEDVMVARDFLRWHYAVQAAQPQSFCSIATRNTNRAIPHTADPEAYYVTTLDYCSLGVCFERSVIMRRIAPHVRREYFEDPAAYCQRNFTGSQVGGGHVEQDALIRRIQEQVGARRPIVFPFRPRAFHAGYYAYRRGSSSNGALSQRVREVGEIIYNIEAMRNVDPQPEFSADSVPVSLETPPWKSVRCTARWG